MTSYPKSDTVTFHPDPISNDRALGRLFGKSRPMRNKEKKKMMMMMVMMVVVVMMIMMSSDIRYGIR